ncbi:MAG: AAA family ATPase [Oscillospiraceae bacterium]|jgi:septum site-determining protein MinD|nr:AAA family ATPase [Oscillospiraceae bacterium]
MQNVTVVTSAKGGVGKSTIAVSLGVTLANGGKKILLIDGDFGLRNLDFMLGISHKLVFDISDVIKGNCDINTAVLSCEKINNLFLLSSSQDIAHRLGPSAMKRLVFLLSKHFDYVIIDSPAGIGGGFVAAAASADKAIVVATADSISLRSANVARCKLNDLNSCIKKRLIINKFSRKGFIKSGVFRDLDEVIDITEMQLLGVIPQDERISMGFGDDFFYLKNGDISKVLEKIGYRFLDLFKTKVKSSRF